jgi:adenosylcobyric acid synthase
MVLGTTSGAGKSWLATALCRWYARQGLKVAPFKAQNMSNNARVVEALGREGEIGSAQYYQALAACAKPDVRMNPVLLKPERDTHSQVVLMGQVDQELTHTPWRGRSEKVWPTIATALDALRQEFDVIVIEGAGSPAEINLMANDIVNMRVARHSQAQCLMICDIDRGGAFAHLYGTWALLEESDRALIRGFVLNKFRGDPLLLAPAPEQLRELTGIETVAVLPMWREHGLPQEDGVFDDSKHTHSEFSRTVYVLSYPQMSNLDEFEVFQRIPGVRLVWARSLEDLRGIKLTDWMILPGSKLTSNDLLWLRRQGLAKTVIDHAHHGGRVLGICGGLQMLGQILEDPHGIDGGALGLGLLSLKTRFELTKTVRSCEPQFNQVKGAWSELSYLQFKGFEIHHGNTTYCEESTESEYHTHEIIEGLAWQNSTGNVLGLYVHGLFENANVIHRLFGHEHSSLDQVFDHLADFLEKHMPISVLKGLIEE